MQTRLLIVFASLLFLAVSAPVAHADAKWLSYSAAVHTYGRIALDTVGNACMLSSGIEVAKFTASGTLIYSITLPTGFTDGQFVAIDGSGSCYVAGTFISQNSSVTPIFILKYDVNGTLAPGFPFVLSGSGKTTTPAAIAIDAAANIYVVGTTSDNDFPETNNVQPQFGGGSSDGFALKLAADGSHLIYSTYVGGSLGDAAMGVAVDSSGAAYVCGQTNSINFPTVAALQNAAPAGGVSSQGFVTKLSTTGAFVYSTYLGSIGSPSSALAIAVDNAGEAVVTGNAGTGLPTVNPLPSPPPVIGWPVQGAFVSKISADGTALVFSSYFGSNLFGGYAITLDPIGDIFLAGTLLCTEGPCLVKGLPPAELPFVNAIQESQQELTDAYVSLLFVSELTNDGSTILFSTLLAGPTSSTPSSIAVDNTGTVYLTSWANPASGSGPTGVQFPMANPDSEPYGNGVLPYPAFGASVFFLSRLSPGSGTVLSAPSTLDLSNLAGVGVGQTASISPSLQIGNYGTNDIHISQITIAGDFQQTNNCPAVLPASSTASICSIAIVFSPTAVGNRSGTITIYDDAPGNPHVVHLVNATALAGPGLIVNPTSVEFNPQMIGTASAIQAVMLQATGNGNITFNHIGISGDFSETNNCGLSLTGGSSCTISVIFSPTSIGSQNASLTISDSAAGSPQVIALSGQGINPNVAPVSGNSSQIIAAGQTATYSLSVSGFSGTVSFVCSGSPQGAICSVNPPSVALSPANIANIQVTVTTSARSALSRPACTGGRMTTRVGQWSPGLVFLFITSLLVVKRRFYGHISLAGPACIAVIGCLTLLYGCGGSPAETSSSAAGNASGTPAGSYQLNVVATSNGATSNTKLTLVVN